MCPPSNTHLSSKLTSRISPRPISVLLYLSRSVPFTERVDQVLKWLDMDASKR